MYVIFFPFPQAEEGDQRDNFSGRGRHQEGRDHRAAGNLGRILPGEHQGVTESELDSRGDNVDGENL